MERPYCIRAFLGSIVPLGLLENRSRVDRRTGKGQNILEHIEGHFDILLIVWVE